MTSKDFLQSSDMIDLISGERTVWERAQREGEWGTQRLQNFEEFPSTFKFSRKGRTPKECEYCECAKLRILRQYLPQRVLEALWSVVPSTLHEMLHQGFDNTCVTHVLSKL